MFSSHLPFSLGKSISNYNTSSLICLVHWFKCVLPLLECFIPEFCRRRDAGKAALPDTPCARAGSQSCSLLLPVFTPAVTTITIASYSPSVAYLIILISLLLGSLHRSVIHEMPFCHLPPPSSRRVPHPPHLLYLNVGLREPALHLPSKPDLHFSPPQLFFLNNSAQQFWAWQQKKNKSVDITKVEVLTGII